MTVAFVHTALGNPPTFAALAEELLPGHDVFHVVDESLLGVTRREGRLTPANERRVLGHIASAVEAGADAVLVTCSSIGPAVEASRPFVAVPVLRVDEPMADEAVRLGRRIGVAATLPTTLAPTAELIERRAIAAGEEVEVVARVADGAFDALSAGDLARHDALVGNVLRELAADVDVIVLAQASMARIADGLPESQRPVAILASPRLGVERLAEVLAQLGG